MACTFLSCTNNQHAFVTKDFANGNWNYANKVLLTANIADVSKSYNVCVTFRHSNQYLYSNIFVMFHIRAANQHLYKRVEYTLTHPDGEWTGNGSGDLFTDTFLLLKNYKFKKAGNYTFEIVQDMRDNPLVGMSDVNLFIEVNK
ncbi:MAG: gliding motility lipoprotein GldH [Sphingobacteriaceae bacterium]|nr:gliding motility lipoprotein GldH [Sphingobacteriaceae bacterium]